MCCDSARKSAKFGGFVPSFVLGGTLGEPYIKASITARATPRGDVSKMSVERRQQNLASKK